MRRVAPYTNVLTPSFVLSLNPSNLKQLDKIYSRFFSSSYENLEDMDNFSVLERFLIPDNIVSDYCSLPEEALSQKYKTGAYSFLFGLGLASARAFGMVEESLGHSYADYVFENYLHDGSSTLGKFCICPRTAGFQGYIYSFDSPFLRKKCAQVCSNGDFEDFVRKIKSAGFTYCRSGLFLCQYKQHWCTIYFTPLRYFPVLVYAPGLTADDAHSIAIRFFGSFLHIGDSEELSLSSPLLIPLELDDFKIEEFSQELPLSNLPSFLLKNGSLIASRYEWKQVAISCLAKTDFSSLHTNAVHVLDIDHFGEKCTVDPSGALFCNPHRLGDVHPFQSPDEAELLALNGSSLAKLFFHRFGVNHDKIVPYSDTLFGAVVCGIKFFFSLAISQEQLSEQIISLPSEGKKVLIVTACLEPMSLNKKGIHFYVRTSPQASPSSLWNQILTPQRSLSQGAEPLVCKAAIETKGLVSMADFFGNLDLCDFCPNSLLSRAENPSESLVRSLWELLQSLACPLGDIIASMYVPKVPDGYDWHDLHIELIPKEIHGYNKSYTESEQEKTLVYTYFFKSWFQKKGSSRRVAESYEIPVENLPGFSSAKNPQRLSVWFYRCLLDLAIGNKAPIPKKRGASPAKKVATPKNPQQLGRMRYLRYEMKKALTNLLELPDIYSVFTSDGSLIFSLRLNDPLEIHHAKTA